MIVVELETVPEGDCDGLTVEDGDTTLVFELVTVGVIVTDGDTVTAAVGDGDGDDERLFVVDKVWVSEAVCDDDDDGVTVLEVVIVVLEVRDCEDVPEFVPVGVGDGDDERLFVVDKVWVSEAVCDDDDDGVTVLDAVEVKLDVSVILAVRDCDDERLIVAVTVGAGQALTTTGA